MSEKLMTDSQGRMFAKMGRNIGLTSRLAQKALTDGKFKLALEAATTDQRIGYVLEPPPGGRIHILRASVQLDCEWQEAINSFAPKTPTSYNVRKVAHLFPPTGIGQVSREYVLLNNAGAGFDAAIVWGEKYRLNKTMPREVFAISKHNSDLNHQLGFNYMWLAATFECEYDGRRQACYAWWDGTERGASLDWVGDFGYSSDWFAFSRDLAL